MALLIVSQRQGDFSVRNTIIEGDSKLSKGEKSPTVNMLRLLKIRIRREFGWSDNTEVNIVNIIPLADE